METTLYILGGICLLAPPFFAVLATQMLYSLARGNDFGHPHRFGFAIGVLCALPFLVIVLGIKTDAFFPELGDTFGITVAAIIGLVLAIVAPIAWYRFLREEDAYGAGVNAEFDLNEDPAWAAARRQRMQREWEVTQPDPELRAALVRMDEQHESQGASLGKHAAN